MYLYPLVIFKFFIELIDAGKISSTGANENSSIISNESIRLIGANTAEQNSKLPSYLNDSFQQSGLSPSNENYNESLINLLKSLKITEKLNFKKKLYPGLMIQNLNENQFTEEALDDLMTFGAYSKLISQLMNSIVNKELGVSLMQQKHKTPTKSSTIAFEKIIDEISEKIVQKIENVHSIIETTGEKIEEIFRNHLILNFTTNNYGCCDFLNDNMNEDFRITNELMKNSQLDYDTVFSEKSKLIEKKIKNEFYQFDSHFNTWTNKHFSCDNGQDLRTHFFSPSGPELTRQFRENLNQNPSIKWQYFMSFFGIHTEYPSYWPLNNYCFLQNNFNTHPGAFHSKYSEQIDSDKLNLSKRLKFSKKKHDLFHYYQQKKLYNDLNQQFGQRHRENLFAAALSKSKLVVIVIDRGSALTHHQMNIAKAVAKYILMSLSHKDKVGIVDLASNVRYASSEACASDLELAYANYEVKNFYSLFIDDLKQSHNSTNHYLGFKKTFDIIFANYLSFKNEIGSEPEIFIPYISRGLLASLTDAKPVMQLISDELKHRSYSFVINTYALIDESRPIMYETVFLREIAIMNFKRFNVEAPTSDKIQSGIMVALNSTKNLSYTLNGIYSVLIKSHNDHPNLYISLPHFDFISKDTHISLSKAFYYSDLLIGVTGVDLSFFDLAEDIIHYDLPDSYAFLMDFNSGKLLYHPIFEHHLGKSSLQYKLSNYDQFQNLFAYVENVEQISGFFPKIKRLIINQPRGSYSTKLDLNFTFSDFYSKWWKNCKNLSNDLVIITYHWRRIVHSSYIVVLVVFSEEYELKQKIPLAQEERSHSIKNLVFSTNETYRFVTHRLDLINEQKHQIKLCKHFNQLATIDTATLFLTSNAFINPYHFEMNQNSYRTIKQYMAYLNDDTQTVLNPGFKKTVRLDVQSLGPLLKYWKNNLKSTEFSKYTVRKYIATLSGAFLLYPGSLLDFSFNPRTRNWFFRAFSNPGKLIFTPPYLDLGGSGYIVTLSEAIYDSTDQKKVWAIMGIDLTLGYFHKIINEIVPICTRKQSSCFLMDNYGYLVVHSSFSSHQQLSFVEHQHISHREPQMINDLLSQKSFIRKLVCNNYIDRTIQRYYTFNTSSIGIITNVVQNENTSCAKYNIVLLDSSNIFFGTVDHSCDNSTTFCPCSMTDRHCLNCHRMEQADCECPCECPLLINLCNGELLEKEEKNSVCMLMSDELKEPTVPKHLFESLDSCILNHCYDKHSESECKGLLGCEWCSFEDGQLLKKPFCTNQNLCFGGFYGSKSPYMPNQFFHYRHQDNHKSMQNSPIGPLTATLIVCFIILIFSVYCFHFQNNRSLNSRYMNADDRNDNQILPHANDGAESNEIDSNNDVSNLVAPLVQVSCLANNENFASPYQYSSNVYRRTESDYGYSTMTANDESELNGPIYINPDIIKSYQNKRKIHKSFDLSSNSLATGSVTSSSGADDSSIVSSPSSVSSNNGKLLPPPNSRKSTKIRCKQKYVDSKQKINAKFPFKKNDEFLQTAILPTVDETNALSQINSVLS